MDSKKLLLIYNPNAGRGVIKRSLSDIVEFLCRDGYEVSIYATGKAGDAGGIVAKQGEDYDRIICCGGDGTLNEVTGGIMSLDKRPLCGYIPAGTVNDFAHSFNLPQDIIEAVKTAVNGENYSSDIGDINGKYFDYIAAFGAFTEVSYETPQASKNILGKLAYFFEGVRKLSSIKNYKVKVTIDDEIFEEEVIYGMITNSFSVGGFLSLFDDEVALDDGKLEAFFIKAPRKFGDYQVIINALLSGDVDCGLFHYRHITGMTIECDEPLRWTIDGDFGGEYRMSEIRVHERAVTFVRGASV